MKTLDEMAAEERSKAAAFLLDFSKPLTGAQIVFARKSVGWTQSEFASFIGALGVWVKNWETFGSDPGVTPRRLALLAIVQNNGFKKE